MMTKDDFLSWLPAELILAVAEKLGKDITSFSRSCRLALQTWEALGAEPDRIHAMLESELQDEHKRNMQQQQAEQPQGLPPLQQPTAHETLAPEQVRPRQLERVAAAAGRRARLFADLPGGWERAGAMMLRLLRESAEGDWGETPLSEGHMARATVVAAVLQLAAQPQQAPAFSPQLARELLEAASGPVQNRPHVRPVDATVADLAAWLPNAALLVCGRYGWEDAARILLGQVHMADSIMAPHERVRWTSGLASVPLRIARGDAHLSSLFRDEDLPWVVSCSHDGSLRCLAACLAAQGGHLPALDILLNTGPALARSEKDCVLAVAVACGRVEVISHLMGGGAWSQPLGATNYSSTAGFVLAARRGLAGVIRHMLEAAPSDYQWFADCVSPALCVAAEEVVPVLVSALVRWREARAWLRVAIREALSAPADLLANAPAGLLYALEDPGCCSALEEKGVDRLQVAAWALRAAAKHGGAGTVRRAASYLERCSADAGEEAEEASDSLCTALARAAAAGRVQAMAELHPFIVRRGLWWEISGVYNALRRAAEVGQAHAVCWLLEQEQEQVPQLDSCTQQLCSPVAHKPHIGELRHILLDSVQRQQHKVVAAILQSPFAEALLSFDNTACELMEKLARTEDLQSMACLLQCPSVQLEPFHLNRALIAVSRIEGPPSLAERQLAMCRLLLEAGASVANGHGAKAFVAACAAGSAPLVALFLERGANPGRERGRPLRVATEGGHEAVVRVLEAALAGGA